MRVTAAVFATAVLLGCAGTPSARRQSSPALEALAFLEGCWSYWNVDWGFAIVWSREPDAWIGTYESFGPMGPNTRSELRIEGRGGLRVSSTGDGDLFGFRALPATQRSRHHILFEGGEQLLELSFHEAAGQLSIRPWSGDFAYELARCRGDRAR